MIIEPIEFQYSDDITVINEAQFQVHMNLYQNYVKKINEIDQLLKEEIGVDEANSTYSEFRGIKRGETFSLDGVILHEFYFENIGSTNHTPDEYVEELINREFGSLDMWKKQFVATARASRGWAVLCYDMRSNSLRNISYDAHDVGGITLSIPILVLDVYEHAYFLQYGDKKNEYIDNFMMNIDWDIVKGRMLRLFVTE